MPARRASPMKRSPAQTRHSLLARATREPARIAASVGARPAAPTMPATTMSTGRAAASSMAAVPAAASIPEPASASRSALQAIPVGNHRDLRLAVAGDAGKPLGIAESGHGLDLVVLRPLPDHGERARPDRAGCAENGHALRAIGKRRRHIGGGREFSRDIHHRSSPSAMWSVPPRVQPRRAARAHAKIRPSTRSMSPPCPGMIRPESLTPKRRFTADSKRSPSWQATDSRNAVRGAAAASGDRRPSRRPRRRRPPRPARRSRLPRSSLAKPAARAWRRRSSGR